MAKTVVGLFDDNTEAQQVVRELVDSGFSRNDIGLLANNTAAQANAALAGTQGKTNTESNVGSGVAHGAEAGVVVGGIAGLLVGLSAFAIPGFGPVIAAGWIATTLAGAGIGLVAGGIIGALTQIGVPRQHAEYYAEGVRRGGTLVTVNAPDNMVDNAVDIFERHGAADIEERGTEFRKSGFTGFGAANAGATQNTEANQNARMANNSQETVIPIVEEELHVGKRQVQGGARVYTHMTERPVEEQVTLREEHLTVDRRPANRPVSDADMSAFKEGTIEVAEMSEEPVVSKQARVVEEVVVGKKATERTETVRDTVRRTDVEVEKNDRQKMQGRTDQDEMMDAEECVTETTDTGAGRSNK